MVFVFNQLPPTAHRSLPTSFIRLQPAFIWLFISQMILAWIWRVNQVLFVSVSKK